MPASRAMTSAVLAGAAAWALTAACLAAPGFAAPRALRVAATGWSRQPTPNAVVPNGTLLAGSCVTPSDCVAVGDSATKAGTSPLAEAWNGTSWRVLPTPMPSGASHGVLDGVSCASARACMAVGHDTASDGVTVVTLAESWNGTAWTVRPTPGRPGFRFSFLDAVSCSSATFCIAVGNYNHGANPGTAQAESWNGTAWTFQPDTIPNSVYSQLFGVSCTATTACTAVGHYLDLSSGNWLTLAESWNGSAWAPQQAPTPKGSVNVSLYAVSCTSADACTATGDVINGNGVGNALGVTLAESWNGTAWTVQPTPNPDTTSISALYGVSCTSPDACSAVGYYYPNGGHGHRAVAEAWNGSTWTMKSLANPGANSSLSGVSCAAAAACVAVGGHTDPSGTGVTLAQRWNGTGWAISKTPSPPGAFPSVTDSVSCASAQACTAVGFYRNSGFTSQPLAQRWNGTRWQPQATPAVDRVANSQLASVSCPSATACMAVGQSFDSRAHPSPLAERWNGRTWTVFRAIPVPPGTGAGLQGVSCSSATACVAVGYHFAAGQAGPLAERWNGKAWALQPVPSPSGGTGAALRAVSCSSATACTAVGSYDVPGSARTLAERWNGSAWTVQSTPAKVAGVLNAVSCASATTCTAAGDGDVYPQGVFPVAEVWQHGTWSVQKTVDPPGSFFKQFDGVSCVSAADCRAVGGYINGSTGVSVPLAEAWNGTAWTMQPVASNPARSTVLAAVSARPGAGFTAVGSYANTDGVSTTLAEITP